MPKLLVVFYGDENDILATADAAVAGANTVRFTEVDLRAGAPTATRHKRVESADGVAEYDGIVIAAPAAPAGTTQPGLGALLDSLAASGRATNTVFAVAGENAAVLEQVSRVGGIIVTTRDANDAKALGARAAKVVGWVRHGLGHEAEHHHHHHH